MKVAAASDRGSVSLFAVVVVFLAVVCAIAVGDVGSVLAARAQAAAAADAAALAGAIEFSRFGDARRAARTGAEANGAELRGVEVDSGAATVWAEVRITSVLGLLGRRTVTARAKAVAARGPRAASVAALVGHPRFGVYARGRDDLLAGRIDPRVVDYLYWLADVGGFDIYVSSLQTGHSKLVAGTTRVSNHWHGRAVDIAMVNGRAVSPANLDARRIHDMTSELADDRPSEFGMPWYALVRREAGTAFFANASHQDHLHVGWR